jgi:hypothetical protein
MIVKLLPLKKIRDVVTPVGGCRRNFQLHTRTVSNFFCLAAVLPS